MIAYGRPNQRLLAIVRLAEIAAIRDTEAREHARDERATCDGYSRGGAADDGSRATNSSSTTESAMLALIHIDGNIAQLDDDITALAAILNSFLATCAKILATRGPSDKPAATRCTADPGHAGYLVPLDEGGWHDPACVALPRYLAGLCNTCRVRQNRWRQRMDERELADERVVEYDSKHHIEDNGVAIVRPARACPLAGNA